MEIIVYIYEHPDTLKPSWDFCNEDFHILYDIVHNYFQNKLETKQCNLNEIQRRSRVV